MAISTTLINRTKDSNGKISARSITFANPEASDDDLAAAVAALNGLSKNTAIDIERVDRHVLSVTTEPVTMNSPNLTVKLNTETVGDSVTIEMGAGYQMIYFTVERDGTGAVTANSSLSGVTAEYDSSNNQIELGYNKNFDAMYGNTGTETTITVNVAASEGYTSDSKVFTVEYITPQPVTTEPMP